MAIPISRRLELMIARYTEWAETGVPSGVKIPESLNQARIWSRPEYEIYPVHSKRDWSTSSKAYGTQVAKIAVLLTKLHTVDQVAQDTLGRAAKSVPREYSTQKARRVAAEDELERIAALLKAVAGQYHQTRHLLENERQDHQTTAVRLDESRRLLAAAEKENALLRKLLSKTKSTIRLVD